MIATNRIPVYQPSITAAEKANVLACLDSGWISSKGDFVSEFEDQFARFVGAKYALSVSNGTVALHAALLALGIGPGDEVIVPSLTYIASANAVRYTGATPVFADSECQTWNLDPASLESLITPQTAAIMPVHLYGQPCDMARIGKIAQQYDLHIIEDAAEALGATIGGRHVGNFGEVGTFSFYGNKTITTGEGGMVITNCRDTAEKIRKIKGQGLAENCEYWHDIIGYNYRMTNICAAIGCAQLDRVDATLNRKFEIAKIYQQNLNDCCEFQRPVNQSVHSQWMVSVLVPESVCRDSVRNILAAADIETRPLFYPVHTMPMYATGDTTLPHAEQLSARGITLPSFPDLTDTQILKICECLKNAIELAQSQTTHRVAA